MTYIHACHLDSRTDTKAEQIGCVSLLKMSIGMSEIGMTSMNINNNGQSHY